jgi:hypothetical protein
MWTYPLQLHEVFRVLRLFIQLSMRHDFALHELHAGTRMYSSGLIGNTRRASHLRQRT